MTEDIEEIFVVVAEWRSQGPMVTETEGPHTSMHQARERMAQMASRPEVLRTAVCRLVYEGGNELLVHDLKRMQGA